MRIQLRRPGSKAGISLGLARVSYKIPVGVCNAKRA